METTTTETEATRTNSNAEGSKEKKAPASELKYFTQEDVNALLAQNKRTLREDNDKLTSEVSTLKSELTQLKSFLSDAAKDAGLELTEKGFVEMAEEEEDEPIEDGFSEIEKLLTPPKGVSKEVWRQVQALKLGATRNVEALQAELQEQKKLNEANAKTLEEERSIRLRTEEAVRNSERDRILTEALLKSRCRSEDLNVGMRYFIPDTKHVEGRGWMFVPPGATHVEDYVPLAAAVKKFIPASLQQPLVPQGGSGSISSQYGEPDTDSLNAEIKNIEDAMNKLKSSSRAPNSSTLTAFMGLQRKLKELVAKRDSLNIR